MNTQTTGLYSALPPACPACGTALPEQAQYCPGCGRRMQPLVSHSAETATGLPPAAATAAPAPPPMQATQSLGPPGQNETRTQAPSVQAELPQRYKVMRLIGRGGMGVVFQCMDGLLERPVAIKLMSDRYRQDPKAEKRFLREARAQATINHPNVAQVLNVGVTDQGRPYLVMEYIEGRDLRAIIREHPDGVDIVRACRLAEKACEGLAEAHARGVVHRDLKPSNLVVLLDHRGREQVKILDLGLAKIIGGSTDLKTITVDTANMLVGTPAYMSPEQVSGAEVDPRADLYSLGVMLFELFTGRLPFDSETLEGWLYQHLHAHPPLPSTQRAELAEVPDLDALVLWCLAKNPEDRPSSAEELGEALSRVRAHVPTYLTSSYAQPKPVSSSALPPSGPGRGADSSVYDPQAIRRSLTALYARPAGETAPPAPPPPELAEREEDAPPDAEEIRRGHFLEISRAAEVCEEQQQWIDAITKWKEALQFADDPEAVNSQIESLKREVEFERFLGTIRHFATGGDWAKAEAALASAAAMRPADPRIQQARARLPRRLVESWLKSVRQKLSVIPEGPPRRHLLRCMTVALAKLGDMSLVIDLLQEQVRDKEARISCMAHAAEAAIQAGLREGMRPNIERTLHIAEELPDGLARYRAFLDIGRALVAYGDIEAAEKILTRAREGFTASLRSPEVMKQVIKNAGLTTTRIGRSRRSTRLSDFQTGQTPSGNLATIAEIQAQAGLVASATETCGLIEDPWIRSQTLAQVAETLALHGRQAEGEQIAQTISLRLAKAKALSAAALARIRKGDLESAAKLAREIGSPEARVPVLAHLAAAWIQGSEQTRAQSFLKEAQEGGAEISSPGTRISALLKASEPLLLAGREDLALPFLSLAGRLIDGIEDPTERLLDLLELATTRLHGDPNWGEEANLPTPVRDIFVRALGTLPRVANPTDREECLEKLAQAFGEAGAHELADQLLAQVQNDQERVIVQVGLAFSVL
ncbi:MAG: hypothetical protein AMXMBFR7_23270 [Planctomycetota bacterium]